MCDLPSSSLMLATCPNTLDSDVIARLLRGNTWFSTRYSHELDDLKMNIVGEVSNLDIWLPGVCWL